MTRRTAALVFGITIALGAVTVRAGGVLETIDITNAIASPLAGQLVGRVIGIRWDVRAIPVQYRVNASTGPDVPNPLPPREPVLSLSAATATMQQAFDAWNDLPASYIEMNIVGEVHNPAGQGFDFVNELTFVTPFDFGAIASSPSVSLMADVTFADGDDIDEDGDSDVSAGIGGAADVDGDGDLEFPAGFYRAGTILDNDVQFNAKASPPFPPSGAGFRFTVGDEALDTNTRSVDLLAVAVHEFGHSHGLSHSMDNQTSAADGGGATMFPFLPTNDPDGERQQRSLHTDDVAWSSYLYPEGSASSGPAALQPGDVAFTRAFGLITGEVGHGVLGQPIAGASVYAVDENGGVHASGFSGTTNLSLDPVSGGLFVLPTVSDAILDGRYVIPVTPGNYAVGVEAVDGSPAAAANISYTCQIGAFFGQQSFHEEFYNRAREEEIEVRPGRSANVRVRRGSTTSGIDIVTNNTITVTGFTQTAAGFTDAEPGRYYAVLVPGPFVAAINPGEEILPHSVIFRTAVRDASVAPVFAEAMLTTGTVNPDGSAAIDLSNPLDRTTDFVGQDDDFAPFFLKRPRALGRHMRQGIERGDIQHLFLVLRVPTVSPFPGTSGTPPLVGIDTISATPRSFQSVDGGATFTQVSGANFIFSLVFAGIHQEGSPAPVAEDAAITTVEDTAVSANLPATDPNGAPLTFQIISSPGSGSVVLTNRATGAFTYTPRADFSGVDSFYFRASNSAYPSNVGTVTITMTPVNDAPVASTRRVSTQPDTALTGMLVAVDPDGDPITFSIVSEPLHGAAVITNAATGEFLYTPDSSFVGIDRFTFQATDGVAASNIASLTITVGIPDEFPPLSSIVATTQEGVAVSGTLEPARPGGGVTFSIFSPPAMGVVTITDAATGAFTYVPNRGAIGYDTFTFAAQDGAASLPGTGLVFIVAATPQWPGQMARVSVASNDAQGNNSSTAPAASADGRFVAFSSSASNLVSGDTNGTIDVFVRDRTTGETTRVSLANDGTQASSLSTDPALSADGRYVAFLSTASNLTAGDTNGTNDVFVHDRQTGETERVSVASDGSQANSGSDSPHLSADGRYVTFRSFASNLVAGDTNGSPDAFVHDRATGETTRVSVASDGTQTSGAIFGPQLSADGRYVSFESSAANLVANDTNGVADVFVHDRSTGATVRVSAAGDGTQANGSSSAGGLSADGRFVAFQSSASNLVADDTNGVADVFVHDGATGETIRVSVASDGSQANDDSGSGRPRLSADGRYVAFQSDASNLLPNDTNGSFNDAFVHDRATGETRHVSVSDTGAQGTGNAIQPVITADGRYVVFWSASANLVPGDTNGQSDVFIVGGVTGESPSP